MSTVLNQLDQILAEAPEDTDVFVSMIFDLAEQVRADMDAQGLTGRALAQRLGKSESEVSKWLSGLHNLTLQSVAKLSVALQVDLFTTRLNPQGYFGRVPLPLSQAAGERENIILANPPFESKPTASPMTRFVATTQLIEGERQTVYEYAA